MAKIRKSADGGNVLQMKCLRGSETKRRGAGARWMRLAGEHIADGALAITADPTTESATT
jgi:hypothetical protein